MDTGPHRVLDLGSKLENSWCDQEMGAYLHTLPKVCHNIEAGSIHGHQYSIAILQDLLDIEINKVQTMFLGVKLKIL